MNDSISLRVALWLSLACLLSIPTKGAAGIRDRVNFALGKLAPAEVIPIPGAAEGLTGAMEVYVLDGGAPTIRRHHLGDGIGGWVTGSDAVVRLVVRVFDTAGTELHRQTLSTRFVQAEFSGRHLMLAFSGRLQVLHLPPGGEPKRVLDRGHKTLTADRRTVDAVSSWNGSRLLVLEQLKRTGSDGGSIEFLLFDTVTAELRPLLELPGYHMSHFLHCWWSPNGKFVGFTDALNTYVRVHEVETGQHVTREMIGRPGHNVVDAPRDVLGVSDQGAVLIDPGTLTPELVARKRRLTRAIEFLTVSDLTRIQQAIKALDPVIVASDDAGTAKEQLQGAVRALRTPARIEKGTQVFEHAGIPLPR